MKSDVVREWLKERENYLIKVVNHKEKRLISNEDMKAGSIHARKHGKSYQYYERNGSTEKYLPQSSMKYVKRKVQYEYDKKILVGAKKELEKISSLLKIYQNPVIEEVLESMPKGKQILIKPLRVTDKEYLEKWITQDYRKLGFREDEKIYHSNSGESFRSRAEALIANILERNNIPYLYEKPLTLQDKQTVYPDFTILDVKNRREIYYEHFGIMDNLDYQDKTFRKIERYIESDIYLGENLLVSFDSKYHAFQDTAVERMLCHHLNLPMP